MSKFLSAIMLVSLLGCGTPTTPPGGDPPPASAPNPAVLSAIQLGVSGGSLYGFTEWGKTDPVKAKAAATALVANVNDHLLPWLTENAPLKTSAEVQAFIHSGLYTGLNPIVQSAISLAAAAIDLWVPIPSSASLSPNSVIYLSTVLKGARDGAAAYLRGVAPDETVIRTRSELVKESKWFPVKN